VQHDACLLAILLCCRLPSVLRERGAATGAHACFGGWNGLLVVARPLVESRAGLLFGLGVTPVYRAQRLRVSDALAALGAGGGRAAGAVLPPPRVPSWVPDGPQRQRLAARLARLAHAFAPPAVVVAGGQAAGVSASDEGHRPAAPMVTPADSVEGDVGSLGSRLGDVILVTDRVSGQQRLAWLIGFSAAAAASLASVLLPL
jgi:hypothetical protein